MMHEKEVRELNRNELEQTLAESACESIDLKDLLAYYYDDQLGFLSGLSEDELFEYANDYLHDFDKEDYMKENK